MTEDEFIKVANAVRINSMIDIFRGIMADDLEDWGISKADYSKLSNLLHDIRESIDIDLAPPS